MEDLFDFILQDCPVPNSQEEFLDGCSFERQDLQFEEENSSATQLTPADPIIICSPPPTDPMECFQTPLENLPSHNPDEQDELRIDGVGDGGDGTGGVGSSAAVDLGRDTDLLLSESSKKKKISVGESSSGTRILKSEISEKDLDIGMSDAAVTVEVSDEFEANDSNGVTGFTQGAQRNDEGLGGIIGGVSGLSSGREDVIMAVAGSSSQDQEIGGETNLARAAGDSAGVTERNGSVEQTLPGIRSSIEGLEIRGEAIAQSANVTGVANSSSGTSMLNSEILENSDGVTGVTQGGVSGLISGREDVIMAVAGSASQDQDTGGETNVVCAAEGLACVPERNGSVEQTLPGVRSSVQGPEIRGDAIAQSAHVTGVANSSSSENSAQQYVKLSDLVSADDDDILVVAIKAGFKFPRPRWWRPEGYGRRASS